MISMEEHLITKMNEGLSCIGLPIGLIDDFEKYLKEETFEENFFKNLPEIDFEKLSKEDLKKTGEAYISLKKHGNGVFLKKYLNTLFYIGKVSIKAIVKAAEYYFQEKDANILLELGVDPVIVTVIYSEATIYNDYRLNISFFNFYNRMYKENPSMLEKAFNYSSSNGRICIAAVLVKNSQGEFPQLKKWLDKTSGNSFKVLFKNSISDNDIEKCKKYIEGGFLSSDKVPDSLIQSLKPHPIDTYILKLLIATNYLILEFSNPAKRFIKLMLMCNYNQTINAIVAFNGSDNKFNIVELELINKNLKIPPEFYIIWMAENVDKNRYNLKAALKAKLTSDKEAFKIAITLCTGSSVIYLSKMLWDIGEGKEYVALADDAAVKEFWELICKLDLPTVTCVEFRDYLIGDKKLEDIIDILRNYKINSNKYYNFSKLSNMLSKMHKVSTLYERGLVLFTYLGLYNILNSILVNLYDDGITDVSADLIQCLESNGVEIKCIIKFLAENSFSGIYNNKLSDSNSNGIKNFIGRCPDEVTACIKNCSVDGRVFLLESLAAYSLEKFSTTITEYLNDTSKVVKEKVLNILAGNLKNLEEIIPLLKSKKQNLREGAIRIICCSEDSRTDELLRETLESEKNEKIIKLLMEKLNMETLENKEEEIQLSFEEFVKKLLKGNKKSALAWVEIDTLSKLRLVNSEELAPEDMIKAIMVSYAANSYIEISKDAEVIAARLNKEDLANLCNEVFDRWLAAGAESKKKWVLGFCGVHGDFILVKKFQKQIEEWPQHARGVMACEAVRALALNGSDTALLIVDGISRKFKFRQVKEAAAVALDFAAEQMGLDRETLSDRIVPSLGFDVRGQRIFDYGERKFTAQLTAELSIEIFDEKGKVIKSLPAPGKNDDINKAKPASEEFKLLKKQLKTTITIQQIRLEMALSMNRKWDKASWVKLFVNNGIMHQFAIGLVWGVYEEGILKASFRYMEDGTFNTKDEEEFEISEDSFIGLVHPIELDRESLELWKEQFENYEVKQPFDQLNRAIYIVSEEEKKLKRVERFGGILINGLSLMGKMTTQGWYKGSVQDGGGYYTFFKEDKNLGIGAELEFSGVSVGGENEEVTIYTLTFYIAGTVVRGSYVYDTVKEQHLLKPLEVPQRFFNEVLYQVDKALASKVGVDENWRKK